MNHCRLDIMRKDWIFVYISSFVGIEWMFRVLHKKPRYKFHTSVLCNVGAVMQVAITENL